MIYILIIIFLILLSYQYDYCKYKKYWNFHFYTILCVLVMLAGFRYRLGNDTINYMKWYESLYTLSNFKLDLSDYEIGFTFLSSLIKTLGGDFYVLQFVTAFIINFSILSYFKKYCRNYTFFCIILNSVLK